MDALLEKITDVPEVAGACLYHKSLGNFYSTLTPNQDEIVSASVGLTMLRLIMMSELSLNQPSVSMRFDFTGLMIHGRKISRKIVLVSFCESDDACSTIDSIVAGLGDDFINAVTELKLSKADEQTEALDEGAFINELESAQGTEPENPVTQEQFDIIEKALISVMGPLAGSMLEDCLESWESDGLRDLSRMPALLNLIYEELDEADIVEEFKQKIAPLLF